MFKHQEKTATWHQLNEAANHAYRYSLGRPWNCHERRHNEREWQRLRKLADERLLTGPLGSPEDTLAGSITAALQSLATLGKAHATDLSKNDLQS
jgi:hypothetical protein